MTNAMSKMKFIDDPSLLTYKEYYERQISLKKYRLPELKLIAKKNHLPVSGNKTVLIERIQDRFMKMVKATKIQTIYRGYLIRHSFRLRGEAFKNRSLCVNDSDFVTRFYSNMINNYIQKYDLDNIILIGHSLGGTIASQVNKSDPHNESNNVITFNKGSGSLFDSFRHKPENEDNYRQAGDLISILDIGNSKTLGYLQNPLSAHNTDNLINKRLYI